MQDCLSLLANLLRLNASNQSYFRETGWVKKLAGLLGGAIREQDLPDGVADWARPQRDKNVWGLLAVLRLFLSKGSLGSQANQVSFWQSGILTQVLDIAFRDSFDVAIRAEVSQKQSPNPNKASKTFKRLLRQLQTSSGQIADYKKASPSAMSFPLARRLYPKSTAMPTANHPPQLSTLSRVCST